MKIIWPICLVIFVIYMIALILLLFFLPEYRYSGENFQYNLIPFQEIRRYANISGAIALRNLVGNVVAFVPFGLLIAPVFRDKLPIPAILGICLAFPTIVELLQLVTRVGVCDVDDVILNFCGELIGFGLYRLVRAIVRRGLNAEQ